MSDENTPRPDDAPEPGPGRGSGPEPGHGADRAAERAGDTPQRPREPAEDAPDKHAEDSSGKPEAEGAASAGPAETAGRRRLAAALWPPRASRAQLIVALLLCVLGLGLAIQVRTTSDNGPLRGARQEDLVRILTELDNRGQRLQDEKRGLDSQKSQLETSSDQAAEALKQTRQREQELGVLAGTVPAEGPGITLTIRDPHGGVQADSLLDTLQELRAAGAEAIQINDVRVAAGTYFSDGDGWVSVDGHRLSQPYVFKVIGNPPDLEPALNIPGGVVQTLRKEQAAAQVERSQKIVVDALRPAKQPDYARSSQ